MTAPTTGEREPDEISAALNDLEHAVKCEYAFPNVHQAMQRKFDRDMSVVTDARNAYDALRADLARVTAESDDQRRRAIDAESDAYEVREQLATAQREAAGLRGLVEAAKAWAELGRDPENQKHTLLVWAAADHRLLENVNALTPAPEAGR